MDSQAFPGARLRPDLALSLELVGLFERLEAEPAAPGSEAEAEPGQSGEAWVRPGRTGRSGVNDGYTVTGCNWYCT